MCLVHCVHSDWERRPYPGQLTLLSKEQIDDILFHSQRDPAARVLFARVSGLV